MKLKPILLLLLVLVVFSCENNETSLDSNNLLIGNWLAPEYNEETTTFKRGNSLPDEAYGISFEQNGSFTERTSGWCGTPPLSFFNIEGNFELEGTLISISTQSYPTSYAWRIIKLTEQELVVKRELTEQELDHRVLMNLFNEIKELSYSVSCIDSKEWLFTAYGAKACGGPQGYIAYSNQLDTVAFLQKVAAYTKLEKNFNIKYGIISDCSLSATPIAIVCENGLPRFQY